MTGLMPGGRQRRDSVELVVFDLDGTLLNGASAISDYTRDTLKLLRRHGALEETRAEALSYRDRARAALGELPDHPLRDMLADLADFVVERGN